MLEHNEILRYHDEAWIGSQNTRERAADDLVFARVTQWNSAVLPTELEYTGQFDMIRQARRKHLSEMRANPVQVTYIAGMGGDGDTAELLEKRYRYDVSTPAAKQAKIIAQQDQVDCGYGAWRIVTEEVNAALNEQILKRECIHEANNRVFRDPNGTMPDGSDDRYCSVIWSITKEGWPEFAEEIGADPDDIPANWRPPEDGWTFPWVYDNTTYNIGEFYHRERVKTTAYIFTDLRSGDVRMIPDNDKTEDAVSELFRNGWEFDREIEFDAWQVTRYWVSGGGNLVEPEVIPGHHIPIVHLYGEVSKVENQWVWEGIVRLAKDPQKLRNFMLSYLADIAARGSRERPYFGASQIEGLEWQFERGGPDDNRAFVLLNDTDDDGNPLPIAPIGHEKTPDVPQAVAAMIEAANGAVTETTETGMPQDVADTNLSGKAVTALQNQVDMQMYTYIDNCALAEQREAEIYASMVPTVYDTTRELHLMSEDGSESTEMVNNMLIDWESGDVYTAFDLSQGTYQVRTKVAPAYQSRRAQQRSEKLELYAASQADPEAQRILLLEILTLDDQDSGSMAAKFARRQLLSMGLLEPETEDDEEYMAAMQAQQAQQQEPDAAMVLAMAEDKKAQADLLDAQTKAMSAQVDQFNAETSRYEAMIKAHETGANIQVKEVQRTGAQLDNILKAQEAATRELVSRQAAADAESTMPDDFAGRMRQVRGNF